MKKKIITTTMYVSMIIGSANAYAGNCASPREEAALNARALQSYLMVAAISCGQQSDYNDFMKKHGFSLAKEGKVLQDYFSRVYSKRATTELNRFITFLANESSKRSLKQEDAAFCARSSKVFSDLTKKDAKQFFKLASASEFNEVHGIRGCK